MNLTPTTNYPKNIILYGPPGTGKTYGTIDLAVDIADGRKSENHQDNKARFNTLLGDQIEFITFHQNYTYEDFVMGIKPDLDDTGTGLRFRRHEGVFYRIAKRAQQNYEAGWQQPGAASIKNFVLIIDEINRANMSRVFGELITLLEDDKRLGAENELRLTLPSGEPFAVPPNLYLIGTMNTADKSLALLDIALRRRFEFIYQKPEPGVLDEPARGVLERLNQAIRAHHKPADFLIGHAYFINKPAGQLPHVFNNRVIPLLMEYFNGRADEVRTLLKEAGIDAEKDSITDQLTVSHVGEPD
ncbi:McrB family protein [Nibrella viscosa]